MRRQALLALALAACGTHRAYDGSARPRDGVARVEMTLGVLEDGLIRTESGITFVGAASTYHASVVGVDDRKVSRATSADVLPGTRSLLLEWKRMRAALFGSGRRTRDQGRVRVPLDAEAGMRYQLVWGRFPPEGDQPPSLTFRRLVVPE